jgi:HlyD family secretion protein
MTANVSIEVARRDDVLKIPTAVLRFRPKAAGEQNSRNAMAEVQRKGRPGGREVFILGKDKNPVPVPIKTGISDGTMVEVAEGDLKENQEVIIEQLLAKKKATEGPPSMRLRF